MSALLTRAARSVAMAVVMVVLLASACGGGQRPTLTGERLVESAQPAPTEAPAQVATAVPESADAPEQSSTDQGTGDQANPNNPNDTSGLEPGEVQQLSVQVLETFPHDPAAFTQGLELHDGVFIESTGLNGESDLRRVVPATGEVTQLVTTPNDFFAEGVTKVGNELIQLTWTENTAFYWDATSFELTKEIAYEGEGWGLCYDGARLVMTDGTPELIFRDPTTFAETGRVPVTMNGQQVFNLNEVECVDGVVWANIWQTDLIVRIDPATGLVNGVVDAAPLDSPAEPSGAVLNGIAWDSATQSFYVTGKLWPTMYRVNFVANAN